MKALRCASLLVTLSFASTTVAQTAPAPAAAGTPEVPVVLSPFTVNTDRDAGFVATSSLAGGRLATDLADTPAAYSVLTREFIDALDITNLATAIEWTVNTNANNDNGALQNSQVNNLVTISRGVTAGTPQRNFFPFGVNFDSYNLDRFDFSRGPNSILFGNGALGGSANVVTKQARLDRATREFTTAVGSWSNYRTTLDVNQPLSRRAALRANAVWQDARGWRDRDFNKIKAVSLTGTLRLGPATEIRLEGEYGESRRMAGFTNINDSFAGWDGVTTFSAPLTTTPGTANATGISRVTTTGYYVFAPSSGFGGVMNYQNSAITLGAAANQQVPIGGRLYVGATPNSSGTNIMYALGLPTDRFGKALAGSAFRLPDRRFTQSLDAPSFWQRFKDVTACFTHSVGQSFFFELAGDANESMRYAEYTTTNGLANTLIDINRNLPNGSPNPNFLQPYSEAVRAKQVRDYTFYNARFAAAWLKDTRWADFKFNVLGGINNQQTLARFMQLNALIDSDPRRWPLANQIRYRYYWNQPSRPLPLLHSVQLVDPVLGLNREVPTAFQPLPAQAALNSVTDVSYRYALAAANARFLQKRLVLLGAVRFDGYTNDFKYNSAFGDYPTNWDGATIRYKPAAPPDYATLTYVPKDAQGRPIGPAAPATARPRDASSLRQPQYAGDRFQDDFNFPSIRDHQITYSAGTVMHVRPWVSLYGNYAQTFTIPPANTTIFNHVLAATVSEGIDAGLRFNLLDQRVRVSLNRYFTKQNNQPVSGPLSGTVFNGIIDANAVGDFAGGGMNIRGLTETPPAFIQDRRQARANGYELELVANVTKSLRVSANYSYANVDAANSGELTAAYIDRNLATLHQIVIDAGGAINAANQATVDTTIPVNQRSPDVNTAVNSWNSMITARAGLVAGTQIVQRTSSGNIFADYTFSEGRLKGVRLGAGARYRGRIVIGNRGADTMVSPTSATTAIDNPAVDAFTPVWAPGYTVATATLGYSWRVMKKYPVTLNLRVDNLLNEDRPHYINTLQRPPNGDVTNPARIATPRDFWYQVPRSYNLTAKVAY
ncbi:MAG: TonB-dependent receptor plug domain-containing protein [Verrucomicrobia bacterium]|nr:TonB-dependent receptor plug domain-containing protein [Verrucomicrobiota bacterium]